MIRRFLFLAALVVVALAASAGPASADEEIRRELAGLAKDIRKVVKNNPVRIGEFARQGIGNGNAGVGIEKMLETELLALDKAAVSDKASYEVLGRYGLRVVKNNEGKDEHFALISVEITDVNSGQTLKDTELNPVRLITDRIATSSALAILGGGSGAAKDDNGHFDGYQAVKNPTAFIEGKSKVLAKKDGLLAVEVRTKPNVKTDGKPAEATIDKKTGLATVDVPRDSLYEVWVTNNSKEFDAAITLTIDGLDVFEFSVERGLKGRPPHKHYVIPAGKTAMIKGWHHTSDQNRDDNVLSFLVSEYGKGAASQKKVARGKVGILTVTLAAAWIPDKEGKNRPKDEHSAARSSNETALGPPDKVTFKTVTRSIGQVREVVSVRYTR